VIGCSIALADIRITQGRLGEAMAVYELGLKRASGQGVSVLRGAADMHVGISELLRERNELDAAAQHLQTSSELGEHAGFGQNPYRWHVAMARVRQAQGDLDGALDLLDRAQGLYVSDFYPEVRPVAAMRARLRLVRGEVDEALQWVRQRQLSVDDQLSYLGEFEHITLAKTLLAKTLLAEHTTAGNERSLHEAIELLERLRTAAQAGQRTGAVIEIIVTRVLADHARGDIASAIALLEEALTLSEPEGYVRVYLDEGASMLALLSAASRKGVARDSVRHLLAAASETAPRRSPQRGLVEPLSERELDVLRLLRTDLNGPDIARQLMVSLNTMRSHTKHIYTKLGVTDRRAALRRAEDLGL
jgi:LuxR family transcriptional regulator, maltose regulon positive regulatory protein